MNNLSQHFTLKNSVLLTLILYLIPKTIFNTPSIGLDPSWQIALGLAAKEQFIFGKDFMFTSGALGYLATCVGIYNSSILFVLFYLFILANGIYFLYYLFQALDTKNEVLIITGLLVFFGWFVFWRDAVSLYFYFLFHVFHFIRHRNILSFVVASMCCLLAFYVKVNSGIIVNVLFVLFIIYNFWFKTIDKITNSAFLIGHFILLYLLSFPLKTDFLGYLKNSVSIISAYNDAVTLDGDNYDLLKVCLMFLAILITILISFKSIIKSFYHLVLLFNVALFTYVSFKNGFLRADMHVVTFFGSIGFILILWFLFANIKPLKSNIWTCITLTTFLSISTYSGAFSWIEGLKNNKELVSPQNKAAITTQNKASRKLPQKVLDEIGNKSVDVLGYEISFIYYNDLKYNPRPIIQSYTAYDDFLINLNYQKYISPSAPDYVLYHYGSIDDRHGFWDEPKIYLALLQNYSLIDTIPATKDFGALMLFKKNEITKKISEKVILNTATSFNSTFNIPISDKILYLKMDYDYTIIGALKRLIYKPDLVYMNLNYDNSNPTTCRIILPIMKSGVPINKKITTFEEAYTFFKSAGKDNKSATSFQLTGNSKWIKDAFRVQLIEYEIEK